MKRIISAVAIALAAGTGSAETVIKDSGEMVEVPEGYKTVFVPRDVNVSRIFVLPGGVRFIDAKLARPEPVFESEARECVPEGEFSLGDMPCED